MEKLITIYPYKSEYKDVFEDFNHAQSYFSTELYKKWSEYQEKYNFHPTHFGSAGSFDNQIWKGMYDNVPEAVELWTVTGEDFGLDTSVCYDEFTKILKGRKFMPPPFGTGLWLPEECHKQNIFFEGRLWIFSPILPYGSKSYKTVQIVLHRSANFHEGQILGTLEHLRPTETWIDPHISRIVQRVLD